MRFMIIVRATKDSEAGKMPEEKLIAGYTLIQVRSKQEAIEWTRRFPNPVIDGTAGELEVRQLFALEDFGPSRAIERFRELGVATRK